MRSPWNKKFFCGPISFESVKNNIAYNAFSKMTGWALRCRKWTRVIGSASLIIKWLQERDRLPSINVMINRAGNCIYGSLYRSS